METTRSQLRSKLKSYCDKAVSQLQQVRVRRRNGQDLVLLAAEEFDSLAETAHLLKSPANAARLLEAFASARQNKTKAMKIEDFRAALGF